MSEKEILQQLKEANARIERIANAVNNLPSIIDGKLKVLNENQRIIIERIEILEEFISEINKKLKQKGY